MKTENKKTKLQSALHRIDMQISHDRLVVTRVGFFIPVMIP